jgi:isopentenyldiphosphate isomerase
MRAENLRHRSVGIAVLDAEGRVLIHRRADDKDVWPGRWDLAVGGVVESGEGWDAAAQRELAEEIGSRAPVREIGRGAYEDDDVKAVVRMYVTRDDGPFTFADGEVVEAYFVTIAELRDRIERDLFVPDSVAMMWPILSGEAGVSATK